MGTQPVVSREGYTFDGWWTDPADGSRVDPGQVFGQDVRVYAHWLPITVDRIVIEDGDISMTVGLRAHKVNATAYPVQALDRNI